MTARNNRLRILFTNIDSEYLKKHRRAALIVIVSVTLLILIGWASYLHWGKGWGWADWTGLGPYVDADGKLQREKTLWDWLELLIIPLVLAIAALLFNQQERKNEIRIADQRNQESILQNYFDKMNDLILEKPLMEVKRCREEAISKQPNITEEELEKLLPNDLRAVRDMAQVRTVTVLRQLDTERKNIVFQFLRDADLASFALVSASLERVAWCEINMENVNLSGAKLIRANLSNANLMGADLSGAKLDYADLRVANLSGANLCRAFLIHTNLSGANLTNANLSKAFLPNASLRGVTIFDADLSGAIMTVFDSAHAVQVKADLSGARLADVDLRGAEVTEEQLATVEFFSDSFMPDGKPYDPAIHTFIKNKTL